MGYGVINKLGKNTLWFFIANFGPRIISFVLVPFYTFWLSEKEMGIQDIILVYTTLLTPYVSLGLYEAIFVFPKGKEFTLQSQYFTNGIIVMVIMMTIYGVVIKVLPETLLQDLLPDSLTNYIEILYIVIILECLQRFVQFFSRGIDKVRIFSFMGIAYGFSILIFSLILVPKLTLTGYWYSLIGANIISLGYGTIAIKFWKYLRIKPHVKYLIEMLKFSIPLIPNATMWWIINSINRPLLISSVGLGGVGLYAVAGKFPSVIGILFTIFFNAFQITALEEYKKPNFNALYTSILKLILIIQVVLTIIFEFGGGVLFDWFIDKKFYAAAHYLPILCGGIVLSNLSCYVGVAFTVYKKTKYFLYSSLIGASIALIFNYILIPRYGIMGACVSIILSQLGMLVYRYGISIKFMIVLNLFQIIVQLIIYFGFIAVYYCFTNPILKVTFVITGSIFMITMDKQLIYKLKHMWTQIRIKS